MRVECVELMMNSFWASTEGKVKEKESEGRKRERREKERENLLMFPSFFSLFRQIQSPSFDVPQLAEKEV